jgi:hypothetical protein
MNVKINIEISPKAAALARKTEAGVRAIELTPEFLEKLADRELEIVADEAANFAINKFTRIRGLADSSEQSIIKKLRQIVASDIEDATKKASSDIEEATKKASEITAISVLSMDDLIQDYDSSDSKFWNILNRYPELSEKLSDLKKYISDRKEIREKEEAEAKNAQAEKFQKEFLEFCTPIQTRKYQYGLMAYDEMADIIKFHVFENVKLVRFLPHPADRVRRVYSLSDEACIQMENLWVLGLTSTEYYEHTVDYEEDGDDDIRVVTVTVRVNAVWNGMIIRQEFILPG